MMSDEKSIGDELAEAIETFRRVGIKLELKTVMGSGGPRSLCRIECDAGILVLECIGGKAVQVSETDWTGENN
jgi:hypothetical protein